MTYSREELDWLEAEWAYHLHGRSAFLSGDDFRQLQQWEAEQVPADLIVAAMETFFQRRAKRSRPRTFIALKQLQRDVAKAMKLRQALQRAEAEPKTSALWEGVSPPLGADPRARSAFDQWQRSKTTLPSPDAPIFLEHFDAERRAFADLIHIAEQHLGPRRELLQQELRSRLQQAQIAEDSPVWKRAWTHHWSKMVAEAWNIPLN